MGEGAWLFGSSAFCLRGLGSRIVYRPSANVMVLVPSLGSSKLITATKAYWHSKERNVTDEKTFCSKLD